MNWLASGCGLCFGGLATIENTIENKFFTYPSGGFMFPRLTAGDSLYEIRTPNVYWCDNPQDISGLPTEEKFKVEDPFVLEVFPLDENGDEFLYRLTTFPEDNTMPKVLIRALRNSSWSVWHNIYS